MPPKVVASKLSPSAYDRWWRDRIEKEEGKSPEEKVALRSSVKLNPLGGAQEILIAGDHLMGAGAMVRPKKGGNEQTTKEGEVAGEEQAEQKQGIRSHTGSVASVRQQQAEGQTGKAGSTAGGKAGSVALSSASYPKTPTFSHAGGSVTDSVIMGRLARLEQELLRERLKREAAEKEMTELMTAAAHIPSKAKA